MSVNDALPYPIYNCKYREYIELVDTNGDPVALASGDTELGKDSATLADATNEMSEGSTGYCSIDFTYSEMAYNCVLVVPKSAGAVTRAIKLFPARLPVLRSGTAQAGAAGSITLDSGASSKDGAYVGCWVRGSNNTPAGIQGEVRKITGYTGSTKVATVAPNWDNTPSSSTTFEILVPSDMSMSTLLADKSDIVDEMETQMQADPTGFHVNVMEVNGTAQTAGDLKSLIDTIDGNVDSILADTGTDGVVLKAAGLNADAVDEILDEVVEGTVTVRQALRLILSFISGKCSGGATTTITYRDIGDTKDRIVMTVDSDGDRSAIGTRDGS